MLKRRMALMQEMGMSAEDEDSDVQEAKPRSRAAKR